MATIGAGRRRLGWRSALPVAAILLVNLVLVGCAAAKLGPALARAVAAHPDKWFDVVVTRVPAEGA